MQFLHINSFDVYRFKDVIQILLAKSVIALIPSLSALLESLLMYEQYCDFVLPRSSVLLPIYVMLLTS